MPRLFGKTALITGGTSGIGLATARQFLREGARVAVTGFNSHRNAAAQEVLGPDVFVIGADAGDIHAQARIGEETAKAFGKLDVLFINAGTADFRPIGAVDEASFDRSFDVNVKGPFFLVQALVPILSNPASIILNGSINAHIGMPNSTIYAATKSALISLARTLSGELIGQGVRANVISPGPVATNLYAKLGLADADLAGMQDMILGQLPVGRFGEADEIAAAATYFASDESRFTVGSELIVDGGMSNL